MNTSYILVFQQVRDIIFSIPWVICFEDTLRIVKVQLFSAL